MRKLLIGFIFLFWSLPALAEEVTLEHQGFELVAELQLAEGRSLKKDGVILLLHDVLGDYLSEPVAGLQSRLQQRGLNVLAVNLSLGLDRRTSAYSCQLEQNHHFEDALPEVHAWVKWLQRQGVRKISLAGLGLGANQMALYASKTTQKSVRRVMLIAPATRSQQMLDSHYQQRFGKDLGGMMLEVERQIAEDMGGTLLEGVGFLNCDRANVAARAFVSYYRDQPYFDTPQLTGQIKMPTLIVAAELDDQSPDLVGRMQQVEARSDLRFDLIEGSERSFGDMFSDQLADRIKLFIDEIPGR